MAKAYISASKRVGSVGGETYSIVKGQTIVKAKPVQVANPRTNAQMRQRSIFIDAVRFYSHALQAFFKFAFQGKKSFESDYNAFMRLNANNGINITKTMSDDAEFPALGNWQLTQGTLTSARVSFVEQTDTSTPALAIGTGHSAMTKVGQLSAHLKSVYGLMEGDIVTLVSVLTSLGDIDVANLLPAYVSMQERGWVLRQFAIDSTSEESLQSVGFADIAEADTNALFLPMTSAVAGGCAVVFSRNTPEGVKTCDTHLVNNAKALAILEKMRLPSTIERVLADWGATGEAILQGALVQ